MERQRARWALRRRGRTPRRAHRARRESINKEARMTENISPKQFRESEGVDDWRVLGDGANAYFRTGSFAAGAPLVQTISALPRVDELQPDIDVRHDGVTV